MSVESKVERLPERNNTELEIDPQTSIVEILENKGLKEDEQRIVFAIDALGIPYKDEEILTGAYIFINDPTGVFRVKAVLDVNPDQAVEMRDRVITEEKYQILWNKLELIQRPYFEEIVRGKRDGKKNSEIAKELKISEEQVRKIAIYLTSVDILKKKRLGREKPVQVYSRTEDMQYLNLELNDDHLTQDGPLTSYIVKSRGFQDLDNAVEGNRKKNKDDREDVDVGIRKIPLNIAKDLIIIDLMDVDSNLKLKLLTYILWSQHANYSLIKEYLIVSPIGLEEIDALVNKIRLDTTDAGNAFNLIEKSSNIVDELLKPGGNFLERYKLMAGIVVDVLKDQTVSSLDKKSRVKEKYEKLRKKRRLRKRRENYRDRNNRNKELLDTRKKNRAKAETRKINQEMDKIYSKRPTLSEEERAQIKSREDESLTIVEGLVKDGFSVDDIANNTNYSKGQVEKALAALRVDGRIEINPLNFKKTARLTKLVIEVENIIRNSSEDRPSEKKIIEDTGSTRGKIKFALHILILLGRIKPLEKTQRLYSLKKEEANKNENLVRQALDEWDKLHPGEIPTGTSLRKFAQIPLSRQTISIHLKKIFRQ